MAESDRKVDSRVTNGQGERMEEEGRVRPLPLLLLPGF